MKRQIARSTVINFARTVLGYGVRLFTMPIVLNGLGSTEYGTLVLVGSIMESSALIQGGLGMPIAKYVAAHLATRDTQRLNRLVNSAFVIFIFTGLVIVLALVVFVVTLMNVVFNIPAELRSAALSYGLISAVVFGMSHVSALYARLIEGAQRYDLLLVVEVVGLLAGPVATAIVVSRGGGLVQIGVVNGLLTPVILGTWVFFSHRAVPDFALNVRMADRATMREIIPFSWRVFLTKASGYLSDRFNPWIIGAFMPVQALTLYNIADRMHQVARLPAAVAVTPVLPLTAGLHAREERDQIATLYLRAAKYAAAISLPVILAGFVLAPDVIRYWLGPRFSEAAYLARVYLSYLAIQAFTPVASQVLVGMGKLDKRLTRLMLGCTAFNIVLSVFLITRIGTVGVIWGSVVGNTLIFALLTSRVLRELALPLSRLAREAALTTFLPAGVVYAALWVVAARLAPTSFMMTVLYGAVAMIAYAILFIAFGLDAREKHSLYTFSLSLLERRGSAS